MYFFGLFRSFSRKLSTFVALGTWCLSITRFEKSKLLFFIG